MKTFKPIIPNALSGDTLLLTGGSGYVGRHLVKALVLEGISPVLIGRPNHKPVAPEGTRVLRWNDPSDLAEGMQSLPSPVMLNIAGHFVSRHKPSDVSDLVDGNVSFPLAVFEACALAGVDRIINIGTSWEYGGDGTPEPANLYAALKASNALLLEHYARQSPLCAINVKLNDTYGGEDTRAKLMPLLKSAWLNGREMHLRAPAQPINLLHITDVIEGLLAAAVETGRRSPFATVPEAFLLARETTNIGNVVAHLQGGIAPSLKANFDEPKRSASDLRPVWDAAPRLVAWQSRVSLEDGLRDYFGDVS